MIRKLSEIRATWALVCLQSKAQSALDELLELALIPFEMTAYKVRPVPNRLNTYEVTFFNSQLKSLIFHWRMTEDFREIFRTALLRETRGSQSQLLSGWSIWSKRGETSSNLRPVGYVAAPR